MKILIDENIPGARTLFQKHGEVQLLPGRNIKHQDVLHCDALITRSVTQVNHALLENTRIRFVATATIGVDHLDIHYLNHAGIGWTSAPGCNADAAAQYSLAMMLYAARHERLDLQRSCVGIVGLGHVGSRLAGLLDALQVSYITCDPPLADAGQQGLVNMAAIQDCEVISLHVPLTRSGPYPTYHMLNGDFFAETSANPLIINACRGDVIEQQALLHALVSKQCSAALDVWPGEPDIDWQLYNAITLGTPHVAGYSQDGKWQGTRQVYQAFCDFFGLQAELPEPLPGGEHSLRPELDSIPSPWMAMEAAVLTSAPVERDGLNLGKKPPELETARHFDLLRKQYPPRRDFRGWRYTGKRPEIRDLLIKLGFHND